MNIPRGKVNVCLISTGNLDLYPLNCRTYFTNSVPLSLSHHRDQDLYVRLRSVGLSYDTDKPAPGYVKVQLNEVEEQASGFKNYNRVLGGFEYPPPNLSFQNYVFKTFGTEQPYLPLRMRLLSQLQVLITDNDNVRIDVESGAPTVVLLEIVAEDEMRENNSFCVTCNSYQPDTYLGNTLSQFTCPLPETIELKDYEVALTSVVFPPQMSEQSVAQFMVETELYSYNLLEYKLFSDLIDTINSDLEKNQLGRELKFVRQVYRNETGRTTVSMSLRRRKLPAGEQQNNFLQVRFSWVFNQIMGELSERQ